MINLIAVQMINLMSSTDDQTHYITYDTPNCSTDDKPHYITDYNIITVQMINTITLQIVKLITVQIINLISVQLFKTQYSTDDKFYNSIT